MYDSEIIWLKRNKLKKIGLSDNIRTSERRTQTMGNNLGNSTTLFHPSSIKASCLPRVRDIRLSCLQQVTLAVTTQHSHLNAVLLSWSPVPHFLHSNHSQSAHGPWTSLYQLFIAVHCCPHSQHTHDSLIVCEPCTLLDKAVHSPCTHKNSHAVCIETARC